MNKISLTFNALLLFSSEMTDLIKVEAGLSLPQVEDLQTMSVDDLNSFLNAAVGTLKEETDAVCSFLIY